MNEFQEILENGISRINDLHRIAAVEWWDGLDYAGDKVYGVMFTDEDEIVHIVSFHNPAANDYERKLYELDCILCCSGYSRKTGLLARTATPSPLIMFLVWLMMPGNCSG